jgi:uncharacterized protein (DUF4415 family)
MGKISGKQRVALEKLATLPDAEIDFTDIPERTDWTDARIAQFYRPIKQSVTMRLDADVVEWFKTHSEKYQSQMNQVLRNFMLEQRKNQN